MASPAEKFDDILLAVNLQGVNHIKGLLWKCAATHLALEVGEKGAPLFEQLADSIIASQNEMERDGLPPGMIQDAVEEFRREARAIFR